MPPCLDIYVMTRARTQTAVDRFLDAYVDRVASEDRGDEELMMLPLGAHTPDPPVGDWDWQPVRTLTQAIAFGLARPYRAFTLYMQPRSSSIDRVVLAFTAEGQVVLGLSIDDPDGSAEKLSEAKFLLAELASAFSAHSGFVACELPPPLLGTVADGHHRVLHRWRRGAV